MAGELLGRQHLNIRGAVEQNRPARGLQPNAQNARRFRLLPRVHHSPDAVQLIVAIQR